MSRSEEVNVNRLLWTVCLVSFLLLSACSGPSQRLNTLEARVGQLEADLAQIRAQSSAQVGSVNVTVEEQVALLVRLGALSRRLAELEYAQVDGAGRGLISYDRALENCLVAIEQPSDLSYVV
jgi:hypothetical protein